ncbi:DUF6622 family protein [Lacrimispora aerotolerans]|uniref:DUF6622 family protein n=1 Tax=Lacrimispora aerotolerans TaxID=36832 RepID=UPI00047A2CF7|nr:DUF6622 family protein [Lacrimispora aerotolerans]
MFLIEVIKRTPAMVWFILAFLIVRGINSSRDGEVSFGRMIIVPLIFMIWGLEKLFTSFHYLSIALVCYVIAAGLGSMLGYVLYSRFRRVYKKEGVFYRTGSYLPLAIILINFFMKYILNVVLAIQPDFYGDLMFNIIYSVVCGVSVGMFIGGIYQVIVGCRAYLESRGAEV